MGDKTGIEWTEATWNPVTGCDQVSPGCGHCYAKTFAERWRGVEGHAYENGFDLTLRPERLDQPRRWTRGRVIFVNSMSDLFHEDIPFGYVEEVFRVMAETPQHTYQVLTKRAEYAAKLAPSLPWPAFDVIAQSQIGVTIPPPEPPPRCAACDRGSCPLHIRIQQPRNHYAGRSHALWYCDPLGTGVFRWHELAFSPGDRAGEGPFGLNCGMEAGQALDSRGMGAWNIARAIEAIDESPNEFIERWTNWFADAIERKLRRPAEIPEHSWQHIEESYLQK